MKILLYTYDILGIGGIETSFYNLYRYLESKGYEVGIRYGHIASIQNKRYKDAGIDARVATPEHCDILIVGSIYKQPMNIAAKVVARQVHADWSDDFWNGAPSAVGMLKIANTGADIFLPVSQSSAEFVKEYVTKPVKVMNNLAPLGRKIKRSKHDKLVIAAFTRMTTEKGLKNYVALRDRLKELNIDAELRVYTNGDSPEGWESYDPIPDITTEFSDIDFVASLADTESFGYTIAEANSCGIPCIIKRTNSTEEFFDNKSNIIIDDVSEITAGDLNRKIKVSYDLREKSLKSVDETLSLLEEMSTERCIIRSMRSFTDIEAKTRRNKGDLFTASIERATELLNHELKLVERI